MEQKTNYYPLNSFRICINTMETHIEGKAFSPLKRDEISFRGIGELIIRMDKLFDTIGYPQAFQDKRTFGKKKEYMNLHKGIPKSQQDQEIILQKKGMIKTIDIIVKSRKNTTWQGEIYDVDGKFINQFTGEVGLFNVISTILR